MSGPEMIDSLTEQQKLLAFNNRFYDYQIWDPKAGDHYTTTRADLELYRVAKIDAGKIYTERCNAPGHLEDWDLEGFTTKDFGECRLYVPDWILSASLQAQSDCFGKGKCTLRITELENKVTIEERECSKVIDQRDHWEDKAFELAECVSVHFYVDLGEASNLNCPVENAIDYIGSLPTTHTQEQT